MASSPSNLAAEEGEESSELQQRLKQTQPFESYAHQAMLSLMVAGASVQQEIEAACAQHGLSASHYNVLRILAGAPPKGHARGDIIDRMIDRGPDVTRLTDRLEAEGLVNRRRSQEDRRVTLHRITERGRALLGEMHAGIESVQERFADTLSEEKMEALVHICAEVYTLYARDPS